MYLIWILESRLIRSNNQSSATLWVLETCLTVGLLPLIIILITASTQTIKLLDARIGRLRERHQCFPSHRSSFEIYDVCEHHYQVALIDLKHEKHFHEQKQSNPITPEQATRLISVPVSKEMISDSVEL